MKTDRPVSYSRSATDLSNASAIKEKKLIGHHVPIDVNLDVSEEDHHFKRKTKGRNRKRATIKSSQVEKKNGMTLVTIAFITMILSLLAGISVKYSNQTNDPSKEAFSSLSAVADQSDSNKPFLDAPDSKVDEINKPLSEILSSRISLISSSNPKFIITASGEKIVPNDVIDGSLTVVDIFSDHIVVSSSGATKEIAY